MIYLCLSTMAEKDAPALARRLVDEGLAACVNIVPGVRSIYRWQGKVMDDNEALLIIKTSLASPRMIDSFKERFRSLHPYECPELVILPVNEGLKEYLSWVEMTVTAMPDPAGPAT